MTDTSITTRTWYLVRHGQTEWNAEKRMQGQWDSKLSKLGEQHADQNGRWLAGLGIDCVYASPIGRVRQTAEIIGKHMPMAPIFDDRLKEWSSGDWSGELYADIAINRPDEWSAWRADQINNRPPGGENFIDLIDRAGSFLEEVKPQAGKVIAILAHGFIIRGLIVNLIDLAHQDMLSIKQMNDVVIRVRETYEGPIVDYFAGGEGPNPGLPTGDQGAA